MSVAKLAIHIGTIISPGFAEPAFKRNAINVDGISCIDAVFITTNMTISFDATFEPLLSLSSSVIALSPSGVAALLIPSMFAIIFITMAFIAAEFFLSFGKSMRVSGDSNFANFSISPDFSPIFIMPVQSAIIPRREMHISIAARVPSNAAAVVASRLPVNTAVANDNKISPAQI